MSKKWFIASLVCTTVFCAQPNAAAGAATLTGLSISGPSTVVWGESAAYVATAAYSDGSTAAVNATWFASDGYGTVDETTGVLAVRQPTYTVVGGAVYLGAVYSSGGITKTATAKVLAVPSPGSASVDDMTCPPATILLPGWNLLGNSSSRKLVPGAFNPLADVIPVDMEKLWSIWKWVPSRGAWAFYSPTFSDGGAAYAASKGYDFLTAIQPGEGFWVNVRSPHFARFCAFAFTTLYPDQSSVPPLFDGWTLIAIGKSGATSPSPSEFNRSLSATPAAAGEIPANFETLWSWDANLTNWQFYAPSLEAQGGTALDDYITSKGYLGFGSALLEPGRGYWLNKASTGSIPFSTIESDDYSGVTTAQNVIIRDASSWEALWAIHGIGSRQPQMPSIDFNTQMVIGVFLDGNCGGHTMRIQKILRSPGKITVEYEETTPPPEFVCPTYIGGPPFISRPFHLVAVPLSSDPVDFVGTVQ